MADNEITITPTMHDNAIWNEAIEAAAEQALKTGADAQDRWLDGDEPYRTDIGVAAKNACWFASEAIRALKREQANG